MPSGNPLTCHTNKPLSVHRAWGNRKAGCLERDAVMGRCSSCRKGSKVGGKGFPHPTCSGAPSRLQAFLEYPQPP